MAATIRSKSAVLSSRLVIRASAAKHSPFTPPKPARLRRCLATTPDRDLTVVGSHQDEVWRLFESGIQHRRRAPLAVLTSLGRKEEHSLPIQPAQNAATGETERESATSLRATATLQSASGSVLRSEAVATGCRTQRRRRKTSPTSGTPTQKGNTTSIDGPRRSSSILMTRLQRSVLMELSAPYPARTGRLR